MINGYFSLLIHQLECMSLICSQKSCKTTVTFVLIKLLPNLSISKPHEVPSMKLWINLDLLRMFVLYFLDKTSDALGLKLENG